MVVWGGNQGVFVGEEAEEDGEVEVGESGNGGEEVVGVHKIEGRVVGCCLSATGLCVLLRCIHRCWLLRLLSRMILLLRSCWRVCCCGVLRERAGVWH